MPCGTLPPVAEGSRLPAETTDTLRIVLNRFVGAFASHFRSWSVLWELLATGTCFYLFVHNLPIMRSQPPEEGRQDVSLYMFLLALVLTGLVAYRRSNALRSEHSWVDVKTESSHPALLLGELLCSVCVPLLLCLVPAAYVAAVAPSLIAPSLSWVLVNVASLVLMVMVTAAVFYLLSAYVLGTEGFAVFAIALVILGFSRSDVPKELSRALAGVPALGHSGLVEAVGAATLIATPPIEELIKAGLAGSFAGYGPWVAQGVVQLVIMVVISGIIVRCSGRHSWTERRQYRRAVAAQAAAARLGSGGPPTP